MEKRLSSPTRALVILGLAFVLFSGAVCMPAVRRTDPRLEQIALPPGFEIEVFATVPNARSLARGDKGTIFVSNRSGGEAIYAVVDRDRDYRADTVYRLAAGMNTPNGIAFRDGDLYVAEINRVLRWDNIEDRLDNPGNPVIVNDQFPSDRHHGWKYLAFGPDDKLYIPVGAPCNICDNPDDPRYASIMRMNPDGSELEVYASGARNSVGFAFHPETEELWFTDNGRDWLGDDVPPDELNRVAEKGQHFGYPYCHGGTILDPQFGEGKSCADFAPPVQALGPHVAALGMLFYRGDMFPETYRDKILIAEHGSWNRSNPIGYRITAVTLDGNVSRGYDVFAEGWLNGKSAWGRPVDLLELPDGSLLVSDDFAGKIYRITYEG